MVKLDIHNFNYEEAYKFKCRCSAAWKAVAKKWWEIANDEMTDIYWHLRAIDLRADLNAIEEQLEDVSNEWDEERQRYQEQLKRCAELETLLREALIFVHSDWNGCSEEAEGVIFIRKAETYLEGKGGEDD